MKLHTLALAAVVGMTLSAPALAADKGEALVKKSDCMICHAFGSKEPKKIGPNFGAIAAKYKKADAATIKKLVTKVKAGGSGVWGTTPMTPHPQLSDADITEMVKFTLKQK